MEDNFNIETNNDTLDDEISTDDLVESKEQSNDTTSSVETDSDNKKDKSKKNNSKPNKFVEKLPLITFIILSISLITLTGILLYKFNKSIVYTSTYNDQIKFIVKLKKNHNVDVSIAIGDYKVTQVGTYIEIEDDIDNNYVATFTTDEKEIEVEFVIINDIIKATYIDGSELILKEIN